MVARGVPMPILPSRTSTPRTIGSRIWKIWIIERTHGKTALPEASFLFCSRRSYMLDNTKLRYLLIGSETIKEMVNDVCRKNFNALFLCHVFCFTIDFDVKAEHNRKFRHSFQHGSTMHNISLMYWTNVNSRNLPLENSDRIYRNL